jgi:hypothetical protein
MKILLYNRNLTSICAPQIVTGSDRQIIGTSRFDGSKGFHTLELELEVYEKNAKAISEVSHLAMRRWEPHFIVGEVPAIPPVPVAPLPGIPQELSKPIMETVPVEPAPRHPSTYAPTPGKLGGYVPLGERSGIDEEALNFRPVGSAPDDEDCDRLAAKAPKPSPFDSDLNVPYFSLKSVAKREGVDISECEGVEHIKAAIMKQRQKAMAPA